MPSPSTNLALAKVLAAAAWADGRVEPEEANVIKTFMLHFGLSKDETNEVALLLEAPVPQSQAEVLIEEFLATVKSPEDKARLVEHIESLVGADGDVTEDERSFLTMVGEVVETHSVVDMVLDRVRGLFTWGALRPKGRHESSVANVLRTRIQDRVRDKLIELETEATGDVQRLNTAVLFGALLHRVAWADGEHAEPEVEVASGLISETFGYDDDEVAVIAETLRAQVTSDVDLHRMVVEFNRVADAGRRLELVRGLFLLAQADGEISAAEVEEIRRIADFMWVDRREFNDIRLSFSEQA